MPQFRSRAYGVAALAAVLLALACAPAAFILAPLLGLSPEEFYRDPVSVAEVSFAVGWFSNLGVIAWTVAATACFLGASLTGRPARRPLIVFGLITTLLGVDDFYLLHEDVLPRLGVRPVVLYAFYFVAVTRWAWRYRAVLRRTPWVVCGLALALLAGSAMVDQVTDFFRHERPAFAGVAPLLGVSFGPVIAFVHANTTVLSVLEDTLKLAGILNWAIFGVGFARAALRGAFNRAVVAFPFGLQPPARQRAASGPPPAVVQDAPANASPGRAAGAA